MVIPIVVTCFALDMAVPVGGAQVVTTNRLGIALVLIAAALGGRIRSLPKALVTIIIVIYTIVVWGWISLIISSHTSVGDTSPLYVIRWILAGCVLISTYAICAHLQARQVQGALTAIIPSALLINAITWQGIINSIGVSGLLNPWLVRQYFADFGPGLNRYMNGLFVLAAIPIGVLVGAWPRRPTTVLMSVGVACSTIVLAVIAGTRQNIIALAAYTVILLMATRGQFRRTSGWVTAVVVALVTALLVRIGRKLDLWEWISFRLFENTRAQILSGSERLSIWSTAIEVISDNIALGIGPGAFPAVVGSYADNAYLALAAEFGIIPAVLAAAALFYAVFLGMRARKSFANDTRGVLDVLIGFVVVYGFVLAVFNELLTDYALWALIAVLITTSASRDGVTVGNGRARQGTFPEIGLVPADGDVAAGTYTLRFGPPAQATRNLVPEADRDEGNRRDGLTTSD